MKALFFIGSLIIISLGMCSCQLGYIAKSAYHQADILRRRIPLEEAPSRLSLDKEQKRKIELAIDVRKFMTQKLNLKVDSLYTTFVKLNRDYVTYAVSAAPKNTLEHFEWKFPIIGSVPYKGYFSKPDAIEEAENLKKEGLDVYVRGVSAYSTLGWFNDPLLSSMLKYADHQLVNTLIHETVHANLYINGKSRFNERVASFLALLGTEAYFESRGMGPTLRQTIAQENDDELVFSTFISEEIKNLKLWYTENKGNPRLLELRKQRFLDIKNKFENTIKPNLKTPSYLGFSKLELNNARLLLFDLYMADFNDFEKLAKTRGRNFTVVFKYLKSLEKIEDPEKKLKTDFETVTL